MRLLGTILMAGLVFAGCDTGNDGDRTGSGNLSPTTTVTVLSGVIERDGNQPAVNGAPYGTLRGVRAESGTVVSP